MVCNHGLVKLKSACSTHKFTNHHPHAAMRLWWYEVPWMWKLEVSHLSSHSDPLLKYKINSIVLGVRGLQQQCLEGQRRQHHLYYLDRGCVELPFRVLVELSPAVFLKKQFHQIKVQSETAASSIQASSCKAVTTCRNLDLNSTIHHCDGHLVGCIYRGMGIRKIRASYQISVIKVFSLLVDTHYYTLVLPQDPLILHPGSPHHGSSGYLDPSE